MTNIELKDIYYATQYASNMSDEGVLETFQEILDGLDEDEAQEYLEFLKTLTNDLMPNIPDCINQKIYDQVIYEPSVNQEELLSFLEAYIDDNFNKIDEMLNYRLSDWMAENDILHADTWEELADSDLRENGVDANCLYWVNQIPYGEDYARLNVYGNDFTVYDVQDLLEDYLYEELDLKELFL